MIFILEDNEDRIRQFLAAADSVAPDLPVRVWRNAPTMMRDLIDQLEHASLISLDHDLNPLPTDTEDPGTGHDVVKMLGTLIPCSPIIIHTSNAQAGTSMTTELSHAGWQYNRVYPFGDQWIPNHWAPLVRKLLAR
jgi:hypothetical protein